MIARKQFEECQLHYKSLAEIIPPGQYYKYCDHWHFLTQRIVFLIALTVYLEASIMVTRETVAEILGCKNKNYNNTIISYILRYDFITLQSFSLVCFLLRPIENI